MSLECIKQTGLDGSPVCMSSCAAPSFLRRPSVHNSIEATQRGPAGLVGRSASHNKCS